MSINWVMLDDTKGFVGLPEEKQVYKSSPRTSLAITTPRAYPGNNPLAIHSSNGTAYLTNQRIVYLPTKPTAEFKSFSAPLLNLHDSHVTVPWFGPNGWQAALQPVPGGNLPSSHAVIELKLTFNEGGAPDFHANFEQIKERLHQAVEAARDSGVAVGARGGFVGGVNMDSVHLDQLPTYEASGHDRVAAVDHGSSVDPQQAPAEVARGIPASESVDSSAPPPNSAAEHVPSIRETPMDAPPGYEETQQQSIQQELDRRLSRDD